MSDPEPQPDGDSSASRKYGLIAAAALLAIGLAILIAALIDDDGTASDSSAPTSSAAPSSTATTATTATTAVDTSTTTPPAPSTTDGSSATSPPGGSQEAGDGDPETAVVLLRQQMPYAEARQLLLDGGWKAVEQPPDADRPGIEAYLYDDLAYREVEDCAGTGLGLCSMAFTADGAGDLVVITANNEPGIEGGPIVYSWSQ